MASSSRYPDDQILVATNIMSEPFTETLRAASEPGWAHAVGHRFVKELFTGAVPDAVMARYIIQDHRFLDSFLTLLGATLAAVGVRAGGSEPACSRRRYRPLRGVGHRRAA